MSLRIELIVHVTLKDGRELKRKLSEQRQKIPLYDELELVKDDFESAIVTYRYPDNRISDESVELTTYEALLEELKNKFI